MRQQVPHRIKGLEFKRHLLIKMIRHRINKNDAIEQIDDSLAQLDQVQAEIDTLWSFIS